MRTVVVALLALGSMFWLASVIVVATCPPDCALPSGDSSSAELDYLFDTEPETAIEETTGLQADGVSSAQARPDGGAIVESANSLTTPDGQVLENVQGVEIDGTGLVLAADQLEFQDTIVRGAENFRPNAVGFSLDAADEVVVGQSIIVNGKGVRLFRDTLTAASADSFIRAGTITTNLNGLNAKPAEFSVISADGIVSGCVYVAELESARVSVRANGLEIQPRRGKALSVTDCSSTTAEIAGETVSVSESIPTQYKLSEGTFSIETGNVIERVETNGTVQIDLDSQEGIDCVHLSPTSTYWYDAPDIASDFAVSIPADASEFTLCLRKHPFQVSKPADGFVDLVEGNVLLRKEADYLRYPTRSGLPASLLMDKLLHAADGFEVILFTGNGSGMHEQIRLNGDELDYDDALLSWPNNFYELREQPYSDGVRRLLRMDTAVVEF